MWAKESDYIRTKLQHIETQHKIESGAEEKQLKIKNQEISRLEQELKTIMDEVNENQNKLDYKRQLEQSRLRHLEERSKILDSLYKTT